MIELRTKDEFELAYRRTQDRDGHSYDPYDIAVAWVGYQKNPADYAWVFDSSTNERSE